MGQLEARAEDAAAFLRVRREALLPLVGLFASSVALVVCQAGALTLSALAVAAGAFAWRASWWSTVPFWLCLAALPLLDGGVSWWVGLPVALLLLLRPFMGLMAGAGPRYEGESDGLCKAVHDTHRPS